MPASTTPAVVPPSAMWLWNYSSHHGRLQLIYVQIWCKQMTQYYVVQASAEGSLDRRDRIQPLAPFLFISLFLGAQQTTITMPWLHYELRHKSASQSFGDWYSEDLFVTLRYSPIVICVHFHLFESWIEDLHRIVKNNRRYRQKIVCILFASLMIYRDTSSYCWKWNNLLFGIRDTGYLLLFRAFFELCFGFDGTILLKFKSDVTIHSYCPWED